MNLPDDERPGRGHAASSYGHPGLVLPSIGLGGHPLGGLPLSLPDSEAERTVQAALEHGISYFDTAPSYGCGLSEHRFGHVLRTVPRDRFVISSKVGRLIRPQPPGGAGGVDWSMRTVVDYSRDGTLRSIEDSLQRLGLASLDIVLIHDVDLRAFKTPEAYSKAFSAAMNGAYRALVELREQGVIRAIGIGVNEVSPCIDFAMAGDFDCFMLAGRYTLLDHSEALDVLLPLCREKKIRVLMAGPYNSGILATGARPGARYFYDEAEETVLAKVRRLEHFCQSVDVPLAAAAIQFPLGHDTITTVVVGAKSDREVERNRELFDFAIPATFWSALQEEGLIDSRAPIPRSKGRARAILAGTENSNG